MMDLGSLEPAAIRLTLEQAVEPGVLQTFSTCAVKP